MYIESVANDKVRQWSKLKTRKGRVDQGRFLVEGYRLVEELLASAFTVEAVLWDAGTDNLPESLEAQIQDKGARLYELSSPAFAAVSDTVTPQGVLAVVHLPKLEPAYPDLVVVLDGLQDPGNVGTLLRSADGFSVKELVCHKGTADPFSPKVVRASMGGLFRVTVLSTDAVEYIRNWSAKYPQGQVLYSAASAETACHEVDFPRPTLVVVGSEATGVSADLVENSHQGVRIPMAGATESLNAAMAGSILMYEMFRQRLER